MIDFDETGLYKGFVKNAKGQKYQSGRNPKIMSLQEANQYEGFSGVMNMIESSVAVCIPFFLYCLLPFIGRALSGYTTLFNLIPTILTNVQASVKVPLIYQIGNCVFRQIPLVMVMYTVMAIALLPFIYKSFRRYGNR